MSVKSKFDSSRKRGHVSAPISGALILHMVSTLRPGHGFRLHAFFFGIPLLQIDLTLPPASPPRSRGLQRHLLSPSRGRARLRERSHEGAFGERRREAKEGHESANELERRCDPFLRLVALLVLLSRPEASGSREGVLALLDAAQAPSLRSAASGAGQGPGPSAC